MGTQLLRLLRSSEGAPSDDYADSALRKGPCIVTVADAEILRLVRLK